VRCRTHAASSIEPVEDDITDAGRPVMGDVFGLRVGQAGNVMVGQQLFHLGRVAAWIARAATPTPARRAA